MSIDGQAKVLNGVETLPKISIYWAGRTNVTDRQQMTERRIYDDIIININSVSSLSLKTAKDVVKWLAVSRRPAVTAMRWQLMMMMIPIYYESKRKMTSALA